MGLLLAILVLVVYPLTEFLLARWAASYVGWTAVVLAVLLFFVLGVALMRRAGGAAARALQSGARTGALPGGEVGDAAMLFLAGLLVCIPGFLTTAVGLVLLVPPVRRLVRGVGGRALSRRVRASGFSVVESTLRDGTTVTRIVPGDVVEGEVLDRQDGDAPDGPRNGGSRSGGDADPGPGGDPRALPPR